MATTRQWAVATTRRWVAATPARPWVAATTARLWVAATTTLPWVAATTRRWAAATTTRQWETATTHPRRVQTEQTTTAMRKTTLTPIHPLVTTLVAKLNAPNPTRVTLALELMT